MAKLPERCDDVEAGLAAQIDAGLIEARHLDPDVVPVQLFGRANVRQFLRKMEDILRRAPGNKEFLKLANGAKAALDDPTALAQWGETLWQQAMERKHPERARQKEAEAKKPKRKVAIWNHPDLGRFAYDGVAWTKKIVVPAFKAFKYGGRANGKCELGFDAFNPSEVPSPSAISVAAAVLSHPDDLVKKVVAALWDDFNGRGPESGIYWHGDLDAVAEGLEWEADAKPPESDEDLLKLLSVTRIAVHKRVARYNKPIVELEFAAAFEEEHGVGVLTDGKTILGTGYTGDVAPFKQRKASKSS